MKIGCHRAMVGVLYLWLKKLNESICMLAKQTLGELVERDASRGYVLYNLGIRFYEDIELTLEEACTQIGLKVEPIVQELTHSLQWPPDVLPLKTYPLDLILEYLRHSHSIFIKSKLPYIGRLVDSFKAHHADYVSVEKDLKVLFPLFAQDFIEHIYQEEDTLFSHIQQLESALKSGVNYGQLYFQMEKYSLQTLASEHEVHDDEMEGIRKITKNYYLAPHVPLHIKVIYHELMQFESSLQTHAKIENEILFPRAMAIENLVRKKLAEKIQLN
jgi:regulator of cell morphogenesis and NO signaling